MHLQKTVLKHVVRGLAIAQKPVQKPHEVIMVTLDERPQGGIVPAAVGDEQVLVCPLGQGGGVSEAMGPGRA